MKPIAPADRKIANIHSAAFKPFVYPDGTALGDSILQLDDGIELGTGFHVYRMPPGMTTRGHRHNGNEQFLILEGEGEPRAGAHYSRAPGAREEGLQITGDAALTTRRARPS